MSAASPSKAHIAARILAALFGAYALAWGFATAGTVLAQQIGASYADAYGLSTALAFLVWLAGFCWAFTTPRLPRAFAILFGGGAALTGIGLFLA